MQISKLQCTQHSFTFNDGSQVHWYPLDEKGKSYGYFTLSIWLYKETGIIRIVEDRTGPPSAKASLHWLKLAIKDWKDK